MTCLPSCGRLSAGLRILGALTLALAACGQPADKNRREQPDVPVRTAVAFQKDVALEVAAVGTVEAFAVVNVTARIDGQLMKVHFVEGQPVRRGQLLFSIDDRPYLSALDEARANLEHARIQAVNAAADARRYGELVGKDYITRSQYEKALAEAEALGAAVKADAATVAKAELNVAYCRITAPIDGQAGSLLVNEGNLIKANDSRPLVVLHQIQPVFVRFAVPEAHLPAIQRAARDQPPVVRAATPGAEAAVRQGRLTFVDNRVDAATGAIALKATFENSDRGLWPGQFVNVALVLGTRRNAVVVPSSAVQMGQQGNYVFAVNADRSVTMRPVTAGTRTNGETVIETGLAVGETVVTDGHLRLHPGARVKAPEPAPPTPNVPS